MKKKLVAKFATFAGIAGLDLGLGLVCGWTLQLQPVSGVLHPLPGVRR